MDSAVILRTLKGAPLACVVAMLMPGWPGTAGEDWFAMETGYGRRTVREGLRLLEKLGFVSRIGRYGGWMLKQDAAIQLPLSWPEVRGKNYPSHPTTTAVISKKVETKKQKQEGRANNAPRLVDGDGDENGREETRAIAIEAAEALRAGGVGRPMCDDLARLAWVTVDYAAAHIEHGRARGDDLALVIHRIREGDPAPARTAAKEEPPELCRVCWVVGCVCDVG